MPELRAIYSCDAKVYLYCFTDRRKKIYDMDDIERLLCQEERYKDYFTSKKCVFVGYVYQNRKLVEDFIATYLPLTVYIQHDGKRRVRCYDKIDDSPILKAEVADKVY